MGGLFKFREEVKSFFFFNKIGPRPHMQAPDSQMIWRISRFFFLKKRGASSWARLKFNKMSDRSSTASRTCYYKFSIRKSCREQEKSATGRLTSVVLAAIFFKKAAKTDLS